MVAKSIIENETIESRITDIFGTDFSTETVKSAFSCIKFLLSNATRHNTESNIFETELQQLGLPKEHASAMSRVFTDNYEEIKINLLCKKLRVNELKSVQWTIAEDVIDCGNFIFDIKDKIVDGIAKDATYCIKISKNDIIILINELKTVKSVFEKYDHVNKFCNN